MEAQTGRVVDLGVFAIANIYNILLTVIFIARARAGTRATRVEQVVGLIAVTLALPLAIAIIVNVVEERGTWLWVLPLATVLFLAVEFALDYVLKVDFRRTRLLAPYLVLFYLGQLAMIGYSFIVGRPYGFVTLASYFINLGATFYSYARVRHG